MEDIKETITDNQYKIIMDNLMKLCKQIPKEQPRQQNNKVQQKFNPSGTMTAEQYEYLREVRERAQQIKREMIQIINHHHGH